MSFGGVLRQSTAVDVLIGPFVDSTDGDTEKTALTIAQADVRLSKNGQTGAQKSDVTSAAHDADGMYNCELDATDTNTVGQLTLWVHVATALLVRHDFQVIEEAVYDAFWEASATGLTPANVTQWLGSAVATPTVAGVPEVDVTHLGGAAQSATDLKDFADDGYDPTTNKVQGVVLTDTVTTYTGNTPQTGDVFPLASTEIADIKAKTDQLVFTGANRLDVNVEAWDNTLVPAPDTAGYPKVTIKSGTGIGEIALASGEVSAVTFAGIVSNLGAAAKTDVENAVWNTVIASHLTAGSTGEALDNAGAAGTPPTVGQIADAVWDEATAGHVAAGSFGKLEDDILTDTAEIGAAGAGLTAINLPNQTMDIVGNITGNLSGSVGSVTGAVGSVTGAVGSVTGSVGSVTGSVGSVVADVDANLVSINGDIGPADRLERAANTEVLGTVGAASTTTNIVTSALAPAAAVIDQFKGRIMIFDKDTTTANLRGQATDITSNTAAGVFTVTALTTAPVSGDTFVIA